MNSALLTIRALRQLLVEGATTPTEIARQALSHSNRNGSRNTYLWQNADWTFAEATRLQASSSAQETLFRGIPVSVKDCFDLAGAPTSCGVRFYRDLHGPALRDSWLVERLRGAGAVITGKTHLHPLAYGITGENPQFGDCLQPGNSLALTGGSSSGAAASVQEGSAVAAIGTDTGGSIRVPAALCGLVGYRASIGRGDWRGAAHLAPSFDTMGWLFRDLEDGPLLASFFSNVNTLSTRAFTRFAVVEDSFLHDCEPQIVESFKAFIAELVAMGLHVDRVNLDWWAESFEIFAPIQSWEAARIHAGHFDRFEPAIRQRLEWGASIADSEIAALRLRHEAFRARVDELLALHELLVLPASPVATLAAGADHSQTRGKLLRYTTPFSLAGVPVVTVPCTVGAMQLAAARNQDESLARLAAQMGARRKTAAAPPAA